MDNNQTKWIKKILFDRVWVKLEGKNSGFELSIYTNLPYPKLNPNLTQSALTTKVWKNYIYTKLYM
jgi:hypothetical protein